MGKDPWGDRTRSQTRSGHGDRDRERGAEGGVAS